MGEENLFSGDFSISTPYGTITVRNGGREITFKMYDSISQSEHHKRLFNYVRWLYDQGVDRINCDHVNFDFLDRGVNLRRGQRILDVVYFRNGRIVECELKTKREIWLDRTIEQLKEMERHCENFVVLVPREETEKTRQLLQSVKLFKTKVDTFEQ